MEQNFILRPNEKFMVNR